jgi:hypothetical protein
VASTYQLTASPDHMAYDAAAGILYVSRLSSNILTRLDLQTGAQTNITLTAQPSDLVVGPAGKLFVAAGSYYPSGIFVINGSNGVTDCSTTAAVSQAALAFDAVHNELYAAETVGSPGDVDGFVYDPAGPSLAQNQTLGHTIVSFFREPVAVSPDGAHLAADVEGISDIYYSGWSDFDPQNMNTRRGKWDAGGEAFSPDSQYVASADGQNFSISTTLGHVLVQQQSSNWSAEVEQTAFSRGGGIVYALSTYYGSAPAVLHWMLVNPAVPAAPTPGSIPLASINCSSDSAGALPASGTLSLPGPATDFIPLCSGQMIVENQANNTVAVEDINGSVLSAFALPAKPMKMALDAPDGWLYVACDSDNEVIKLDLVAGTVSKIPLSGAAYAVAVGQGTQAFASQDNSIYKYISIFDGGSLAENASRSTDTYSAADLFFDPVSNNLLLADASVYLERMAFNSGSLSLTETEELLTQPQHAALQAGGLHLAATGGGSGYTDYDAQSFATTYGNWSVPTFPGPCSYSQDGSNFLGSDQSNLYVYDAVTHVNKKSIPLGTSFSDSIASNRFSRGGSLAFSLLQFYGATHATIVWSKYP